MTSKLLPKLPVLPRLQTPCHNNSSILGKMNGIALLQKLGAGDTAKGMSIALSAENL